jgi:hypothetical protein
MVVESSSGPDGVYLNERGQGIGYRARTGAETTVTPLPNSPAGLIYLSSDKKHAQAIDADGHPIKTIELGAENGFTVIHHEPNIFAYRLEP